ncbi:hypothetical protein D3C85_841310 [compost metagenome]
MCGERKVGTELAAEPGLRADAQTTLHGIAQVESQGQSQPGATELTGDTGSGLGKGLENLDLGLLCDTDAGIAHFDSHAILKGAQAHIHPSEARELEGVRQQVADDLANPRRIAQHQGGKLRIDQACQLDAGCRIL